MADYDLRSNLKQVPLLVPAVWDADNTPTAVDLGAFRSALINIHVGVGGITFTTSNKVEFTLTHGDTNVYADSVAVTSDEVVMPYGETFVTGGILRTLNAAKAAADTELSGYGYIGKKRYIFLLANFSGTHSSGTPMAAHATLGNPHSSPLWQSDIEE